ncbi:hypothetical protein C0Q70_08796 [Pomacea canaliculata]|uniref:Fibronectin type-III domain-containing protein n=1 Tax=Pomacea canaliculata TaxID=400727 RepID=A0A2T7P7Y8_POMCA|nr:hypothetical protein C0Q70_08796 [Pomacea canaliculata]
MLSAIFLLTTVAGCVLAAQDQQGLQDGSHTALVATVESLLERIQSLEDLVRSQGQIFLSEKQQWLAEKESLQIRVERLETLCSFNDVFLEKSTTDGNEAVSLARDSVNPRACCLCSVRRQRPSGAVVTQLTKGLTKSVRPADCVKNEVVEASTSVYVHWGSSTCTSSAVLVYSGEIGGSFYDTTGAAVNYLCLPLTDLTLADISTTYYAQLYGGEYESQDAHQEKDPVCAVCRSSHATNVMIPAKTVCPAGWTSEYSGWLMAGWTGHNAASEFICVDSKMEERIGSERNDNGKLLYYTVTVWEPALSSLCQREEG